MRCLAGADFRVCPPVVAPTDKWHAFCKRVGVMFLIWIRIRSFGQKLFHHHLNLPYLRKLVRISALKGSSNVTPTFVRKNFLQGTNRRGEGDGTKIQVFLDVTLCRLVRSVTFRRIVMLSSSGPISQWLLEHKIALLQSLATCSPDMSQISDDLILHQQRWERGISRDHGVFLL
jgi:hypothetical protein